MDIQEDSKSGKSSDHRRFKVMVSITTPSGVPAQREPMDIVLVLHVQIRLIAPPNWHDLLVNATQVVLDVLGEHDRLAIIPASLMEERAVKPTFYEMSAVNKKRAIDAVDGSQAMRRNTQLLADLESAESALYNRKSKEKEERAAHIIVISNSNEDLRSVVSWRFRSVHAFGFRVAHNGREMGTIASNSESTYAVFDEGGDEISPAFVKSMEKITSGVEPLEVRLKCGQDVVLSAICAPRISYFISNDKKFGIIWASARRRAVTNFVVELQFPKLRWSSEPNRASGSSSSSSTHLSVEAKYGRHPNSKSLKGVCKEVNGSVSRDVAAELSRMEAVKIVSDELTALSVRDKLDCEQLHKAADRLRRRWKSSLPSYLWEKARPLVSGLDAEMQQMETRLHNNYLCLEYMLSWKSQQRWPLPPLATAMNRQATADDPLLRMRVLAQVDEVPKPIREPQPELLPVLVEVTVPVEGLAKEKRGSLDLVVVLDVGCRASTSREMKKKRKDLLEQAMNFIRKKLSYKDRLAIIQADQSGHFAELHKPSAVKMDLKLDRARHHRISSANLLSNSLADAVKLLDGRGEDNKRLGLIILISDRDDISDVDDISILQRPQRCNYTVHTFGLHGVRNSRTMHAIATASSGIYATINDHRQDKISQTFIACIRNITCTIAVNTQVNIICSNTSRLKLSAIESGQFESSIGDGKEFGSIFAGDLCAGAVKRFVAYLEKGQRFGDARYLSSLFQVNVTWQSPHHDASGTMKTNEREAQITIIKGQPDASTDDVGVVGEVTDDDVDEITDDVVDEIARLKEMKIVSAIIVSGTEVGEVLADRVKKLRQDLKLLATDIRVRPKGSSYEFRVDEESLASLGSKNDLDGSQLSYILSWLSCQGLCEKPPSAPSRRRQDTEYSSQQDQENMSPEDELLMSLSYT